VPVEEIVPGLHRVLKGYVNAYSVEDEDGLVLIDTGLPQRAPRVIAALRELDRSPSDVKVILITHHHSDHVGSLADLVTLTGATVYVHPADRPIVRGDRQPPGPNPAKLSGRTLGPLIMRLRNSRADPARVDHELVDGQDLDLAGGIRAIHTPGHTAGQTSFLWNRHGGVLIAGDAAGARGRRVAPPIGALFGMFTEDIEEARRSFRKLADLEFEVAVFGHGNPIRERASEAFRGSLERARPGRR
jgi:glyoxylase-like metal-dependent hydrolase (beta-lactamase superfamily II)